MMRRLSVFLALSALGLLFGLTDRPRDPWVFRCVLDKKPRMVVIMLHEHLCVAYDATNCSLYKAWDGDVKFQGAVYDDIHGPQPESRGEAYRLEPHKGVLSVTESTKSLAPIWRGYRFENDGVVLQYDVALEDGSIVRITERPEVRTTEDGSLQLQRTFSAGEYPPSVSIVLTGSEDDHDDVPPVVLPSGQRVELRSSLRKAPEANS